MTDLATLAIRIRQDLTRVAQAVERLDQARAEWIEASLALATDLHAARRLCGNDDNAFGVWVKGNNFEGLNEHDRAALINMAENLDLSRRILQGTTRMSYRLIWEKQIVPEIRFGSIAKPDFSPDAGTSQENVMSNDPLADDKSLSQAKRAENFALRRGVVGITTDELVDDLEFTQGAASRTCDTLQKRGLLIRKDDQRLSKKGTHSQVYVHNDFAAQITLAPEKEDKPKAAKRPAVGTRHGQRGRPAAKRPAPAVAPDKLEPVRHVVHLGTWQRLSDAERGMPSPEEAHLPDPDRPGLNRVQGEIARGGHVRIIPVRDRNKSIVRRLPAMIRKLDAPLTEYVEHAAMLVKPEEVAELLGELDNTPRRRQSIIDAAAAVIDNLQRTLQHIESIHTALLAQHNTTTSPAAATSDERTTQCS